MAEIVTTSDIEYAIRSLMEGWGNLASSVQSVVVRDIYNRFSANRKEWRGIVPFVVNYLDTVESLMSKPQLPLWAKLSQWSAMLTQLDTGQ